MSPVLVLRSILLATAALAIPAIASAQAAPAAAAPVAATKRIYTPADLARFAPKTAYDMLRQVPGFTIHSADTSQRGLGQASENVLVNGQRIASKSGGAIDELQRTAITSVERIEVLDAASLGIAGLSGQVANVVLKTEKKATGQFEWRPDFRAHFAKPRIFSGSASYNGTTGPLEYNLSVKSDPGRGGFGGDILIYDANNVLTERRREVYHGENDPVTLQAKLKLDAPGSSVANLTLAYTPYWSPAHRRDRRFLVTGETRNRSTVNELDGWYYDINGDYEFALGPGRMKLIGLRHFDHEPLVQTQVLRFDSGADSIGTRFSRDTRKGETIGRAEYGWKGGRNDWQLSLERAFNSLDQKGRLFTLDADEEFVEVPFPEGTGKVTEVRYEGLVTWSRPLSSKLDLQVAAGAEVSTLDRVDDDQSARKFFRPKGSVTLGWRPSAGWDASFKLRRRVGQISFYDFLAQPQLSSDRQNAGNPDLVPPQSWEVEAEVGRELGPWGKTRLRTYYHRISDIIDVIPIGDGGQGVGNLPHATRFGAESTSTLLFDPIGWKGAKVDLTLGFERTRVGDPLTGEKRAISGTRDRWGELALRHDIPGSDLAWGGYVSYDHFATYYRLTEVFRSWEGPFFAGVFVEHKNLAGLTVRAEVNNITTARHRNERTFYGGYRNAFPITGYQSNDQLIGPIFELSVKGTF